MKPLVVANWKMNPKTESEALELFAEVERIARTAPHVDIVVAPPFPFLSSIERRWNIRNREEHKEAVVHLAAQDLFWEEQGAFTGEVSPAMEKELGVSFVIVGHSERRRLLGETNEMVSKKLRKAFAMNIRPILCIGEAEREGDDIPETVGIQLRESIRDVEPLFLESLLVAYEPVWAIGTGTPETPSGMHKAGIYIRKVIAETFGEGAASRASVLYGGSVSAANAASFFTETNRVVSGLLVGGASLRSEEFRGIIESLDQLG